MFHRQILDKLNNKQTYSQNLPLFSIKMLQIKNYLMIYQNISYVRFHNKTRSINNFQIEFSKRCDQFIYISSNSQKILELKNGSYSTFLRKYFTYYNWKESVEKFLKLEKNYSHIFN
ncbi:hypothetical protein pb186bvf_008534 [Paramecium bursaria]